MATITDLVRIGLKIDPEVIIKAFIGTLKLLPPAPKQQIITNLKSFIISKLQITRDHTNSSITNIDIEITTVQDATDIE